jgi:hypothetical protein
MKYLSLQQAMLGMRVIMTDDGLILKSPAGSAHYDLKDVAIQYGVMLLSSLNIYALKISVNRNVATSVSAMAKSLLIGLMVLWPGEWGRSENLPKRLMMH